MSPELTSRVDEPTVVENNSDADVELNRWQKHGDRLYFNGFSYEPYLDLETGEFDSRWYDVEIGGDVVTVTEDGEVVLVVSLSGDSATEAGGDGASDEETAEPEQDDDDEDDDAPLHERVDVGDRVTNDTEKGQSPDYEVVGFEELATFGDPETAVVVRRVGRHGGLKGKPEEISERRQANWSVAE